MGGGYDRVRLTGGNDRLDLSGIAISGVDLIDAGAGDDILVASVANDILMGGTGNDTFEFHTGFGHDTIIDFEVGTAEAHDLIDLVDAGFADFSQLLRRGERVQRRYYYHHRCSPISDTCRHRRTKPDSGPLPPGLRNRLSSNPLAKEISTRWRPIRYACGWAHAGSNRVTTRLVLHDRQAAHSRPSFDRLAWAATENGRASVPGSQTLAGGCQ